MFFLNLFDVIAKIEDNGRDKCDVLAAVVVDVVDDVFEILGLEADKLELLLAVHERLEVRKPVDAVVRMDVGVLVDFHAQELDVRVLGGQLLVVGRELNAWPTALHGEEERDALVRALVLLDLGHRTHLDDRHFCCSVQFLFSSIADYFTWSFCLCLL